MVSCGFNRVLALFTQETVFFRTFVFPGKGGGGGVEYVKAQVNQSMRLDSFLLSQFAPPGGRIAASAQPTLNSVCCAPGLSCTLTARRGVSPFSLSLLAMSGLPGRHIDLPVLHEPVRASKGLTDIQW